MTKEMVSPEDKQKIVGILTVLFPNAKIYLFGSRARGTAQKFSDIDIALDEGIRIDLARLGEARAMFAESSLHYSMDLVDMQGLDKAMIEQIHKDGILWKT